MTNRTTQSALVAMGLAAGAAAATWLHSRRLAVINTSDDELIEPESAELPLGRSADPDVDAALSRHLLPQDDTSGAALLAERQPPSIEPISDLELDEIWDASPDQEEESASSESYDAVNPESLGGVWLERATQTTHSDRVHRGDPSELAELESFSVSEGTLSSSGLGESSIEDELDEIRDDELDLPDEDDYQPAQSAR